MPTTSPLFIQRQIGETLISLREAAGLTQTVAAQRVAEVTGDGCNRSRISYLERVKGLPTKDELAALVVVYAMTTEQRVQLETLCTLYQQGARPWWDEFLDVLSPGLRRLIECEDNADKGYANSSTVLHGLVQVPEYVDGLFAFAEVEMGQPAAERLKAVRARRQQVLFRPHNPLVLDWYVTEGALRYVVGGPAAMRRQLEYLLELIERSVLKAHVVPFASGTAASLCRDWTLLEFPDKGVPDILWSDERGGIQFQEDPKSLKFARLQRRFISQHVLAPKASRDLIHTIRRGM
jgi:transcriptional regulator with XRE-family HTH domain